MRVVWIVFVCVCVCLCGCLTTLVPFEVFFVGLSLASFPYLHSACVAPTRLLVGSAPLGGDSTGGTRTRLFVCVRARVRSCVRVRAFVRARECVSVCARA